MERQAALGICFTQALWLVGLNEHTLALLFRTSPGYGCIHSAAEVISAVFHGYAVRIFMRQTLAFYSQTQIGKLSGLTTALQAKTYCVNGLTAQV